MPQLVRVLLPLVAFGVSCFLFQPVSAQDQVYQYKDRDGRQVFTNTDNIAVGGKQLEALDLPPLTSVDFEKATPAELKQLDDRVEKAHEKLQDGKQCEAMRVASRVPFRSWMWREHQRELFTAVGLFVLSLIVGFMWEGRWMRTLMPIAPFVGCVYLVYVAYVRTDQITETLYRGLRACSADLPDGDATSPAAVRTRYQSVFEVRDAINDSYQRQERLIDQVMAQRW